MIITYDRPVIGLPTVYSINKHVNIFIVQFHLYFWYIKLHLLPENYSCYFLALNITFFYRSDISTYLSFYSVRSFGYFLQQCKRVTVLWLYKGHDHFVKQMSVNTVCFAKYWILDFFTQRPDSFRFGVVHDFCALWWRVMLFLFCTPKAAGRFWGRLEEVRPCPCRLLGACGQESLPTSWCTPSASYTSSPAQTGTTLSQLYGKTSCQVRINDHLLTLCHCVRKSLFLFSH